MYATAGNSGPKELAPIGLAGARIYAIVDLGMQPNKFKEGTLQRKVRLSWEIAKPMSDGRPFAFHKNYTLSLDERSSLYADLKALLGEAPEAPFDMKSLLGKECALMIAKKIKADKSEGREIGSILPAIPGQDAPKDKANKLVYWSFDEPNMDVFNALPDFLKADIQNSPNWANLKNLKSDDGDDIGF
jgi:hypothetical protein